MATRCRMASSALRAEGRTRGGGRPRRLACEPVARRRAHRRREAMLAGMRIARLCDSRVLCGGVRSSATSTARGAGRRAMASRNMATDPDDGNWPPLSDEDRRGIARIRRQIDEEFGVAPDAPRWLDRWRRPLLLALVGVAVGCAGCVVWSPRLSASRATEPPRPAV